MELDEPGRAEPQRDLGAVPGVHRRRFRVAELHRGGAREGDRAAVPQRDGCIEAEERVPSPAAGEGVVDQICFPTQPENPCAAGLSLGFFIFSRVF